MRAVRNLVFSLLCVLPVIVSAQDGAEVSVADINLPNLRWGTQQANFEVTNKTEYLKFIVVVTTIAFNESYFKPVRTTKTTYILGPLESKILTPRIYVPGNYGRAIITVQLYDVVDTVDILLPRQKIFEQPITVQYHIPDAMIPYVTQRITLPPLVDHSITWDNDMARTMMILLRQKKSIAEIAAMASADVAFVKDVAEGLVAETALRKTDSSYQPTFAVIFDTDAKQFQPLAEQLADSLAALVTKNLPAYRRVRDSLVKSGTMTADTSDFTNAGGVLFHEYPVIGGLFLWNYLGKEFITEDKKFNIFEGTDYCNAYTPFYMYAVQGGEDVNGRHFFSNFQAGEGSYVEFADFIPHLKCEENYRSNFKERKKVTWEFPANEYSEGFVFSPDVVAPAIAALAAGSDSLIARTRAKFMQTVNQTDMLNFAFGPKYWFWNWTATMTLDKLIKAGTVIRRGNGHYEFQSM